MPSHVALLIQTFIYSAVSFIIAFVSMPFMIKALRALKFGKNMRENTLDGKKASLFYALHQKKTGTPTMGGVLIWCITTVVIIFSRVLSYLGIIEKSLLDRGEVYLPFFTLITVGVLGMVDDYLNIRGYKEGITSRVKMIWLTLFSFLGSLWFFFKLEYSSIHFPGIGDFEIGFWYIPVFIFIILATSNAVNFTDGLDGLAAGLLMIAFGAFGVLAFAKGLFILCLFCGVINGAIGAFLWFNIPPAQIFMGDTGALSLGATLGVIALMTDSVLVLPLIGFIFVTETMSIILQLFWKRFFQRKLFHIAPLHHHYEHIGWPEHTIVMRFWIIGAVVALIGLLIGILGMGTVTIF